MGLACIECNINGYNNKDENPNPIIAKVFVVRKLSRMLASDGIPSKISFLYWAQVSP